MAKKILVILGHPNPDSFNHAIAAAACRALQYLGHRVTMRDLYAENFNPILSRDELADHPVPAEIVSYCEELAAADGILVVHPNWRDQPPAIVKGWVDRVFRVGVAFEFSGESGQPGRPVGLLQAQAALVLTTSDSPVLANDPLDKLWKGSILEMCGVSEVVRKNFSGVLLSDYATRSRWLLEVEQVVRELFR